MFRLRRAEFSLVFQQSLFLGLLLVMVDDSQGLPFIPIGWKLISALR